MQKNRIGIIGGSGYVGGELLRMLLGHPNAEITTVTSERLKGQYIKTIHPHLRGRTALKFSGQEELSNYDTLFLCTPHKTSMNNMNRYKDLADSIIDLSADYRLNNPAEYNEWYGKEHNDPETLKEFVYGIPEIHREKMKTSKYVSSAGCNATAIILGLYPLMKEKIIDPRNIIAEAKVGSSESGNSPSQSSHYSERANSIRSFKPTGHRHTAEIVQELDFGIKPNISLSVTSIGLVRGILATIHTFPLEKTSYTDIIKLYKKIYSDSPFIRMVVERTGNYRYPDPKLLWGTNYCDIGIDYDEKNNRLVVITAIDNLMKGAAGQAVQAYNIMKCYEENTALEYNGLHPI